jgi:phosphoesterase RecJ-like protein
MPNPLTATTDQTLRRIVDTISARRRFLISSHVRPDGDAIGSQLAMAFALRALGKEAKIVNRDAPPAPMLLFPGVSDIEIASGVTGDYDAVIVMECGDLSRTGVEGLDRYFVVNIDHHPGNTEYGQINWFDPKAAACAEMVYELIRALRVRLTSDIATHIYLAILTDTGSFHYSSISPGTFEICRELLLAGVDPVQVARDTFDTASVGQLKLTAAVLSTLQVDATGRIAIMHLSQEMARAAGGTYEDVENMGNLPLTVKEIQAVAFFKKSEGTQYRISMRSKGDVDVRAVAKEFGGGGHKNAAGCTIDGTIDSLQKLFVEKIARVLDAESGATADTPGAREALTS